jgi:hypothetical protein
MYDIGLNTELIAGIGLGGGAQPALASLPDTPILDLRQPRRHQRRENSLTIDPNAA